MRTHEGPRVGRRERDRVAIERNPAHHQPGARVPGIVLPHREDPARAERPMNVAYGGGAIGERNVMEDTIAEGEIERATRLVVGEQHELRAAVTVFAPSVVERSR